MSIKVQSHVWESSAARGSDLLILLAIADFADDSGAAWPSVETLARKARLSKRQAQYCLRSLMDAGLLAIEEQAGPHGTHRYRVLGVQNVQGADSARVQNPTRRGAKSAPGGVQPIAPEPSYKPPKNRHSSPPVSPKPKSTPKTTIPDDFDISDRMVAWAAEKGITRDHLAQQIERFKNNAVMKQMRYADWDRAFQNWMLNARDWGHLNRSTPNGSMTVMQGGKVGRDGLTDDQRGWREDPGPKGWTSTELARMGMAGDLERSGT